MGVASVSPPARAQESPVYVDDSAGAAEGIRSATDQASAGNDTTAVEVLQRLLDEEPLRLVATADDPDLFVTVRSRAHDALLADETLLARYRALQEPAARRLLEDEGAGAVERTRLLTTTGFEAALREAQRLLESARFPSARRVLAQLERHPDRLAGGEPARQAARLASLLARYDDGALEMARRWRRAAGAADEHAGPIEPPRMIVGRSALSSGPALAFDELVAKPLRSRSLAGGDGATALGQSPTVRRGRGGLRVEVTPDATVFPALAGDRVYVCDGSMVAALDRFTLETVWRYDGEAAESDDAARPRLAAYRPSGIEGPFTAAVDGDTVVVALTARANGRRLGDGLIHALSAADGAQRWAVDLAELDPAFENAGVAGPPVISEGVAVLTLVKQERERRLVSVRLAALDLRDGSLRWSRLLGSAGSLPQGYTTGATDLTAAHDGVLYRADMLGFIAAVDAATGRPLWVRRDPVQISFRPDPSVGAAGGPVVAGERLFAVSPDRASVLCIEASSGRIAASRPASEFGSPGYLVVGGGVLGAVSATEVASIDPGRFESPDVEPATVLTSERGRFLGRAVVAGDRIAAPVDGGFLVAPLGGWGEQRLLETDRSGNAVVSESQLLVLDGERVHSFLAWGAAQQALSDRIARNPADPSPAITLAELAYRAEREELIVPALDRALGALECDPLRGGMATPRRRLFEAIDQMLAPEGASDATALSDGTAEALLERLEVVAATPEQRATYLLRRGARREWADEPARAVAAYQSILDDPSLSAARVGVSEDRVARARDVAFENLRRLVRRFGPEVYAAFEREAEAAVDEAMAAGDVERLIDAAQRYPVSPAAARAWLEAARRYEQRSMPRAAIASLEEALRTVGDVASTSDRLVGEIGGSLAMLLARQGRPVAASETLDAIDRGWPGVQLLRAGEPLAREAVRSAIVESRASLPPKPRIGLIGDGDPQTVPDRVALRPLLPGEAPTDRIVLAGPDGVELWGADPEGGIKPLWQDGGQPGAALVRHGAQRLLLATQTEEGAALTALDATTGEQRWASPALGALMPADEGERVPEESDVVVLPGGTRRPATETLVVADERSAALVSRLGVVASFDQDAGETLWSRRVSLAAVYDAAAADGRLVIVGARRPGPDDRRLLGDAAVVCLDLRTGEVEWDADLATGPTRWVRLTREGDVVIGGEQGIEALDLYQGRRRWSLDDRPLRRSREAWAFPGRLIVMTVDNELRQVESESGTPLPEALETDQRLERVTQELGAAQIGDRAVFALPGGFAVYDRRARLAGFDRREAGMLLGPFAFASDRVAAVDGRVGVAQRRRIRIIDAQSARLLQARSLDIPGRPEHLAIIDDRILLSTTSGLIVLDAPRDAGE